MSETTVIESPKTPKSKNGSTDASRLDDILRKAELGLTKLTELVEAAKTAAATAAESQTQITSAATDAQAKLAEITSAVTQVVTAKTQIADEQAVVATKSDHIQRAQEHADKVRADLDRAVTAANQQVTAAEAQKTSAQSAAESVAQLLADVRTSKGAVETDAAAIDLARKNAEQSAAQTKSLADKAAEVEADIAAYEKRLGELDAESAAQLKTIVELLPGATSAGLAHAWNERRKTFLKPHNRWKWLFVGSVLAIVAVAISGLWHVYHLQRVPTYDELVRLWLARLPVAGALLWLALHASRESALAKRLEEDYGFKSVTAACFEGFRKQMSEIVAGAPADSPLAKLCANTLTTIAAPPGRIYDQHELAVSPTAEFKQVAEATTDLVKAVKK